MMTLWGRETERGVRRIQGAGQDMRTFRPGLSAEARREQKIGCIRHGSELDQDRSSRSTQQRISQLKAAPA